MCFTLGKWPASKPEPKIAIEDITVYKVISNTGQGRYNSLIIDRKAVPWQRGWHYMEPNFDQCLIRKDRFGDRIDWEAGENCFHSCKTASHAKIHHWRSGYRVVEMIIPKGAKYFYNNDEYISSDIIYPEK